MNVKLLKRVITRLRRMRHPEHFNMDLYGDVTPCGVTACIAGEALLLSGYKVKDWDEFYLDDPHEVVNPETTAQKLLGLTNEEIHRLFYKGAWPKEFRRKSRGRTDNPAIYNDPKVAARRIEHFIATKGAE